jgi:hypothetical protein
VCLDAFAVLKTPSVTLNILLAALAQSRTTASALPPQRPRQQSMRM